MKLSSKQKSYRYRAGVLCEDGDELLTVTLRDPHDGREFCSLPGGGIETGETSAEAAIRETKEETGYDVKLVSCAQPLTYQFPFAGQIWTCHCDFYLAKLAKPGVRHEQADIQDPVVVSVNWLSHDRFRQNLSYHQPLWQHYQQMLQLGSSSVDQGPP